MSETDPVRQVCVLLRDGRVLTDEASRLPSYDEEHPWIGLERRARTAGDPGAVLVMPQVMVGSEPTTLLSVFASRPGSSAGGAVDGTWTALDDVAEADPAVLAALREAALVEGGLTETPARRPAWFSAGWYDEVDAWIDARLAASGKSRAGETVPVKAWSLSAVLRVPSDPSSVWFKASCRHFHAEPALTRLVAEMLPEHAPTLVAGDDDRAWLLLEEMPGAAADDDDEDEPSAGLGVAAARIAATLQLRSLDHLDEIEAAGVPVRGLSETLHGFDEILVSSVELDELSREELASARGMRDDVHAVVEELASLGLPETLVHGDLHPGNVAHDGDSIVLYDWSDAAVSHPFLDLAHLTGRLPEEQRDAVREAYAAVWRTAYPDADIGRALELAEHVDTIYQLVTYEQIYRAQEDASYWEMRGVVARSLRKLPARFPRRG
ncbi:MAG TPA: aminoglycoside phosphotransferase family protein [Nocardioides sp.]|uniref:aminoglycoside phosphotransferase family protein n=1 Tax=Nocardioides sp. TaxID=35761 RepID=UPI002F420114